MMKNSQKPRLRFKGFTDAWEQRKLGEMGSISMNKRIFKSQTTENGDVPFYKIGTFGETADAFISRELFEEYKNKYPYPEAGDILISASGSIGRTVEFIGKDEYFQDSNIVWLKHDGRLKNSFLKYFYTIVTWEGLEGSTIKRLYNKNMLETNIYLPQILEQTKIGTLFSNLDNLITLHQRKYDKLSNMKKAFLEKMFPQNNQNTPKLRFKGFTDTWEQRKLGELGEFKSNGVDKKSNPDENPVNLLNYMDVYNRRKITKANSCDLMKVTAKTTQIKANSVERNDVFFTPTSETAEDIGHVMVIEETLPNTVYSYHLVRFRPLENMLFPSFPNYGFASEFVRKQLILSAQGVQRFVINKRGFEETLVMLPIYEEQEKISILLTNLDNLITLHQRKLEKLKNIKKACLERMFV